MNFKPLLANKYNGTNPRGWWKSEKLDGVRARWTGAEFVSRNGKEFPAPPEMLAQMPGGVMLDGEIFGGRGSFQRTVGRVRKGDWQGLRFLVFDSVNLEPFEARQEELKALPLPDWCEVVEQVKCRSAAHLNDFESALLAEGAEGVMLRKARSHYELGRSQTLLKVKRFKTEEAVVTGHEEGTGKHAGRLGALVAEFAGKVFRIGTGLTDAEREEPPAIGATVTFRFFELTDGGIPRFPVFCAVRNYE